MTMYWIVTTSIITLAASFFYFAFVWKFNWIKDTRKEKQRNRGKYSARKSRVVGDLPPVYPNGWFALLESRELKRGDVKYVAALGENFAVFRTESGFVKILDAYCPHLGANMGINGQVIGNCLECPFHLWTFDGDSGRCQSIPYAKKVPEAAKMKAWRCCEVNHLIFVWYHAESAEPDWYPEAHEKIASGAWRYHGRNEFYIHSHIQEIPENGADWAHLSAVHGPAMLVSKRFPWLARHSWTNASWSPRSSHILKEATEDERNDTKHNVQEKSMKHRATSRLHHNVVLLEKYSILELDVTAEQTGPGYVELEIKTAVGTMYILQTVTPLEPMLQRVTHMLFAPMLLGPYARIILLGETFMFDRDVIVWNNKKYEKKPVLVKEDRSILLYRRWYSQFYSANSPTYQMVCQSLDW